MNITCGYMSQKIDFLQIVLLPFWTHVISADVSIHSTLKIILLTKYSADLISFGLVYLYKVWIFNFFVDICRF